MIHCPAVMDIDGGRALNDLGRDRPAAIAKAPDAAEIHPVEAEHDVGRLDRRALLLAEVVARHADMQRMIGRNAAAVLRSVATRAPRPAAAAGSFLRMSFIGAPA